MYLLQLYYYLCRYCSVCQSVVRCYVTNNELLIYLCHSLQHGSTWTLHVKCTDWSILLPVCVCMFIVCVCCAYRICLCAALWCEIKSLNLRLNYWWKCEIEYWYDIGPVASIPQIQSRNWAQVPLSISLYPLPFPFPPREPTPLIQLGVLGERCKLPQRVWAEPGAKRFVVHFQLKLVLLVNSNVYRIFLWKKLAQLLS